MADISKINAVALADIAKLDAVLAANIAKVNGLVFTAAAGEFLLDTYTGAAAGYSVRRLATSATVLLRVRRDTAGGTGDDDEADVAYDSNNIVSLDSAISNASVGVTATTLGQFLNVGTVNGTTYTNPDSLTVTASCYVDTWYDQSGNSNDAEQATETSQPQIHDGTVNTDLITENGNPAVFCADNNDGFDATAGAIDVTARTIYQWSVYSLTGVGNYPTITPSALYEGHNVSTEIPRTGTKRSTFTAVNAASAINANQAYLRHSYADTTDFKTFLDGSGTAIISGTDTNTDWANSDLQIFDKNVAATGEIKLSEFVMWQTGAGTVPSNRTGIEENINSEYLIYQPTDAPTSGLLATYTGAAAAYSVRQLSDKAVIALRIRRDSDDEETNIGWDANGDLDTTAISDFCQTANGYVTRWWDQSTEGNHADQATDASQPQIYNGTAVITENGKPALDFDGSNDILRTQNLSGGHDWFSIFSVYEKEDTNVRALYNYGLVSGGSGSTDLTFLGNGFTAGTAQIQYSETASTRLISTLTPSTYTTPGQYLTSIFNKSTAATSADQFGFVNGAAPSVTVAADNTPLTTQYQALPLNIGGHGINDARRFWNGTIQEAIFYPSDQDGAGNRTGIETNINTYFSIY